MQKDTNESTRRGNAGRRQFLTIIGAMGVAGLAGCGGDDDGTPTDTDTGGNGNGGMTGTDTQTETGTPTETATPTETPSQDFPSSPPTVVTFSGGGSVSSGGTTTLTASVKNPYLYPIQSVQLSLEAPNADWTVKATGDTDLGTIETSARKEVSWEITAPEGADGEFTLSGSVSYASETDELDSEFTESITALSLGGVPADGIEAYFSFDGDTATNPITGTEASVTGEPATDATGIVNGAWGFTQSGDAASTTDAVTSGETLPLNGETATVGAWVNFTDHESYGRFYQVGGSVSGSATVGEDSNGYEVIFHGETDAANDLLVADGNGRVFGDDTGLFSDLSAETWYLVVLVRDGGEYRLHVFDETGELDSSPETVASDSAPPTTDSEPLIMMSGDDSETVGRMDEVYAYSRALSEGEVMNLYDNAGGST
jgi:hypothetical protein